MFNKETIRNHHNHDHDHNHDHSHEEKGHHHCSHGGNHEHGSHECRCAKREKDKKDEKTLNILLVHWVNHNESHEDSFREWANRARELGKEETACDIEKAIEYIQKANDMLFDAKKHM